MSEKTLILGKDLHVPRAIAARTVFIAGTKGSGKTYTGGVMAEEMLEAGVHLVILDPLGVWWGLRHDEKGGPDGYPIVILGGEHGDRPLLPTAGAIVAEYLVRSGQAAILDMSGFASNAEQDRFVTDLLHALFRLKASEKSALHLMMDEADMFVPEASQRMKGQERLVGASRTIVTKGRSRGLSMTMITQRPQAIAKSAIEESDLVLCHRMQGVNAVGAMKTWTGLYASKDQAATFFETLPQLADGECWVWSPQFLKVFERRQIRRKRTFDSSRTPDPGETVRKPKAAAAVDLDKLTDEMKATAEEAAKNDPTALKRRIAELEKAVGKVKPEVAGKANPQTAKELQVARRTIAELKKGLETAMKVMAEINAKGFDAVGIDPEVVKKAVESAAAQIVKAATTELGRKQAEFDRLRDQVRKSIAAMQKLLEGSDVSVRVDVQHNEPFTVSPKSPPTKATPVVQREIAEGITGTQQRIIDALAWYESLGNPSPSLTQIGAVALIDPTGGHFSNVVGPLSSGGYVERGNGTLKLTDAGRSIAQPIDDPGTLKDYHDVLRQRVRKMKSAGGKTIEILDYIISAGGEPVTNEQIGEACSIDHTGGHFSNMIGPLGTAGLIERSKGVITPTAVLFPEGLR
jgi:hypothetical protein